VTPTTRPPCNCTRCGVERLKGERWFWQDNKPIDPLVYCYDCAKVVVPAQVEARRAARKEIARRSAAARTADRHRAAGWRP
jgi:hypothetical protein